MMHAAAQSLQLIRFYGIVGALLRRKKPTHGAERGSTLARKIQPLHLFRVYIRQRTRCLKAAYGQFIIAGVFHAHSVAGNNSTVYAKPTVRRHTMPQNDESVATAARRYCFDRLSAAVLWITCALCV